MESDLAYSILGLQPGASVDEIKAARRKMAKALHPDVDSTPAATLHMQVVNAAYEHLMVVVKRAADLRSYVVVGGVGVRRAAYPDPKRCWRCRQEKALGAFTKGSCCDQCWDAYQQNRAAQRAATKARMDAARAAAKKASAMMPKGQRAAVYRAMFSTAMKHSDPNYIRNQERERARQQNRRQPGGNNALERP